MMDTKPPDQEQQQGQDGAADSPAAAPPSSISTSTPTPNSAMLANIRTSLKQKDDTSRFVGLTMLRSFLDSPSGLNHDQEVLLSLWQAISPKFLDRLVRAKRGASDGAPSTLDLGVSVIHKFTLLLPESAKRDKRLVERIPTLVEAVLQSSEETTALIVQTLLELVTFPEGARAFAAVPDTSPLVEVAPAQPLILDVFDRSWLNCMAAADREDISLQATIDKTVAGLVSSFKGTDGVTLLRFLGEFLRKSNPQALPPRPTWLGPVVGFVHDLLVKKPNPEARHAYTLVSASLLEVYPADACRLLFTNDVRGDRPSSYLLLTLILTEIRASAPRLLSLLNDPSYPDTAKRISSAFDVVTHFIGYLVRAMDAEAEEEEGEGTGVRTDHSTHPSPSASLMPAGFLLKLRTSISETMSLAIEFLRDRYDASVAGAMGLHPDARPGAAEHAMGTLPISWESTRADVVDNDPLVLSATRALALWLREDDNKLLRKEAAGLTDMLLDLYRASASASASGLETDRLDRLDFRSPVLVALEGIVAEEKGRSAFATNGCWGVLTADVRTVLGLEVAGREDVGREVTRGLDIVRVLLSFAEAEAEKNGMEEDWLGLVTAVAAWDPPEEEAAADPPPPPSLLDLVLEFRAAVLQLVTALLVWAPEGMRKRYVHSSRAIVAVAERLSRQVAATDPLRESFDDVVETLAP